MKNILKIILLLSITVLYGCHSSNIPKFGSIEVGNESLSVKVGFSDRDRSLINQFYNSNSRKKLPPGLAKKKRLPPGLAKQVRKNGSLPPGLEKERLPKELERSLDTLAGNYIRMRIGADIVLMDGNTRVILDVIKDVPF